MINDKEKEEIKVQFGTLTLKHALLIAQIQDLNKECAEVADELSALYEKITGVKKDGSTVCKA